MPTSERKGRFTVTVGEAGRAAPRGGGDARATAAAAQQQAPAAAGSGGASGAHSPPGLAPQRAVKRGRFLVSCLPCTRLAPTLSLDQEARSPLLPGGGGRGSSSSGAGGCAPGVAGSAAPAACIAEAPFVGVQQQQAAAGSGVAQPPPAAAPAVAAAQTSTAAAAGPSAGAAADADASPARRVRFSEHTRSYVLRGRFAVQEVVLLPVAAAGAPPQLGRSASAPECCLGGQAAGAADAAAAPRVPLSADVLAAQQLMSGLPPAPLDGQGSVLASGGSSAACSLSSEDSGSSSAASALSYGELPSDESHCSGAGRSLAATRAFASCGEIAAGAAAPALAQAQAQAQRGGQQRHPALKRSASVYCRRGRFVIQTTSFA